MSATVSFLIPVLASAVLAFALTPLAARLARRVGAVDMPGRRKVHDHPIPRLGGLAVVSAIAAVWMASEWLAGPVLPIELSRGLSLGILPLLAVSVWDDVRPVRARWKFLAHVLGATVAVASGVSLGAEVHLFGSIHLGIFAAPLSVLWLIGITNAFNLIDGLDGLSAGLALIAALSMAAVFALVGQPAMAGAALVMAGALAGFLPYNVHPARQFLGDSGATAIGFCLGAFALKGGSTLSSGFAALVPVFVMGLPIADTLIAMARRAVRRFESDGGSLFDADRNHIHHRLIALGIDHGRAVLVLYGAGAALAVAAFGSMFLKAQDAALFIVALLIAAFVGVHRLGYDEFAFIRRGTVLRMYDTAVVRRSMFVVFADLAISACAAYTALALKFDTWNLHQIGVMFVDLAVTFAPLTALLFWYAGMYRGGWRVAGVTDLARASGAALAVAGAGLVVHRFVAPVHQPPSVFLIYALVNVVLVTMSRASYVLLLNSQRRASTDGVPALLYGSGRHAVAALSEILDGPGTGLRPIGFIDDDPTSRGRRIGGLSILGTPRELDKLAAQHGIKAVLLTMPSVEGEQFASMARTCERTGIRLMRMRLTLEERREGVPGDSGQLAGVAIEIADTAEPVALRPAVAVKAAVAAARVDPVDAATVPIRILEAEPCGRCGGRSVHRSKARSAYERLRKLHTPRRLFRCNDCGWRGWLLPLEQATPLLVAGAAMPAPEQQTDLLIGAEPAHRPELAI
jgi:UDP-GlcNAc:undecaprenyl-phosphate GlcNAc-1-phosphate transferase